MRIRSMLIVPSLSIELMEKSLRSDAEGLMFELEDGVHPTRKDEARQQLVQFLRRATLPTETKELTVRVNDIQTAEGQRDVIETVRAGIPSVLLGKPRSADDFRLALELIIRTEHETSWTPGTVGLWGMVETARGVQDIEKIVAVPRMRGVFFGGGDLSAELEVRKIGISGKREVWDYPFELMYARERTVLAARAAGICALDTPYGAYRDLEATKAAAQFSAQLGFDGMGALSPRQIPVIHEAFLPTERDLAWARAVVAATEEAEAKHETVVILDGEMIDGPFVKSAYTILRRFADSQRRRSQSQTAPNSNA